jgi:hypothetical protein
MMQKVRFWDPDHWRFRAEETRTADDPRGSPDDHAAHCQRLRPSKALSPILLSHLPRRYPHRHEACITNHPIGDERMNRIVGEEIRLWVLLTPIDEAFVLCSCDHGIAPLPMTKPTIFSGSTVSGSERLSVFSSAQLIDSGWQGQHAYEHG